MNDNLEWFKFNPVKWQNGSVTMLDDDEQGVFVNVCCYYWIRKCQVTEEELNKKFAHKQAPLKGCIDAEIIEIKNGIVIIKFLEAYRKEIVGEKKYLSECGRKGAKIRELNKRRGAKATLKPPLSNKDKEEDKDKETASSPPAPRKTFSEDVERVYKNYPPKCLVRSAPLLKSRKNKERIEKYIKNKEYTADALIELQTVYAKVCVATPQYMQAYSTFLNSPPSIEDLKAKVVKDEPTRQYKNLSQ